MESREAPPQESPRVRARMNAKPTRRWLELSTFDSSKAAGFKKLALLFFPLQLDDEALRCRNVEEARPVAGAAAASPSPLGESTLCRRRLLDFKTGLSHPPSAFKSFAPRRSHQSGRSKSSTLSSSR